MNTFKEVLTEKSLIDLKTEAMMKEVKEKRIKRAEEIIQNALIKFVNKGIEEDIEIKRKILRNITESWPKNK